MASLQQRNDSYRVIFRFRSKQHFVAIGKVSEAEAKAKAAQVGYLLLRLEQRLIELPSGIDVVEFVKFDGKPPVSGGTDAVPVAKKRDLNNTAGPLPGDPRRGPRENDAQNREIERRISEGDLDEARRRELWDSLYLRVPEVAEVLAFVKENATYPWIYLLVVTAAHTGMRRSELLRVMVTDVDFEGGSVLIRERKRVKGKRSTRRAPLTPLLKSALEAWLAVHPGGNTLFCHSGEVPHSTAVYP